MKKLFSLLLLVSFLTSMGMAQVPAKTTSMQTSAKTTKTSVQKTSSGPMKKDGTPDKRYKANQQAQPAATPMKKDGTPDKRYKANKTAPAKM